MVTVNIGDCTIVKIYNEIPTGSPISPANTRALLLSLAQSCYSTGLLRGIRLSIRRTGCTTEDPYRTVHTRGLAPPQVVRINYNKLGTSLKKR
jgi:hypothetical protein